MNNKFFFFLLLFLVSCSSQQTHQFLNMEGEYYTIDIDEQQEESIPLSSIFKNTLTIILETADDNIIGRVSDIQVFDNNIYILDSRSAKSLFVFDMEGRFVRKIGRIGQGPGDYIEINDFTFDMENRIIFLCDYRNRIHKYELDGTYINTITIQATNSKAIFIQFYDGRLYLSQTWWNNSDDNFMLLEIDPNDGKILSSSLPVKYNKGWDETFTSYSRFFLSRANDPPRYNQMFMDYIVSVGKEITPYIELKSKHLTTERDIESFRGKGGIPVNMSNVLRSSKIFNVHCFIENDDYILFRVGIPPKLVVLFNKKTREVKLANHLINDLIFNQDQIGKFVQFVFSNDKGAFVVLDTQMGEEFNNLQMSIKNNEVVPDLDKLDELMKLEEDANPVIFFYEFK